MDLNTVFTKTSKGAMEVAGKSRDLSREQSRILMLVDGKSSIGEILDKAGRMSQSKLEQVLGALASDGYIRILRGGGQTHLAEELGFSSTIIVDEANTQAFFEAQAAHERRARNEMESAKASKEQERDVLLAELKAEQEAATRAKEQAEAAEKAKAEAAQKAREEAERKAATEAKARAEAEARAREQAEAKARLEAEAKANARKEAEAKAKAEAEAQARAEAEARMREAEAARRKVEAEKQVLARQLEEAKLAAELESRAKRRLEARAREEEETRQRIEAEARAKLEEETRRRAEAEERARAEAEARRLAEEAAKAQAEAERKAREEAEARAVAEAQARAEAERRAREEAEARAKAEAEAKARAEAERQAREEAEAKAAAERKAREEAEARAKAEEEAKAKAKAEAERKAQEEEAARQRAEAEEKARKDAEARARAEEEARQRAEAAAKAEAERRAREEEAARQRAEAEEKARKEAEAQARAEEEARQRAEEEAAARAEAERRAQEEEAARQRAEAEEKARKEAEAQARAEEEARQRAEEEAVAKAEAERRAREEAEAQARLEEEAEARRVEAEIKEAAEQAEREEADAKASAEAEKDEAERRTRELAEERARAEAAAAAREEERLRAKADAEAYARMEAEEARRRAEEQESFLMEEEGRERDEAEARAMALAQARTEEQAALERILGRPRLRIDVRKWARYGVISGVALLVLTFLLAHIISFNFYAPRLEGQLAQVLGERTKIGELSFSAFPAPHWKMERITLGGLDDIKISKAEFQPALGDWFSDIKHIKHVNLEGVTIDRDSLSKIPAWFARQSRATLKFERIEIKQIKLDGVGIEVPSFDARVDMNLGAFGRALLTTSDRRAKVEIEPMGGAFKLHLQAEKWVPPLGANLQFDQLEIQGMARGQALELSSIYGTLHGGTLQGNGSISWGDAWKAAADIELKRLNLATVIGVFTGEIHAEGTLDAKAHISAESATVAGLLSSPQVRATFLAKEGVLGNVDLVRAINAPARSAVSGGQTRFNDFSGYLQVTKGKYQYRQLRLTLGMLSATGAVEIEPNKAISGTVASELKSKATAIKVPLTVSGTLATPTLRGGSGAAPARPKPVEATPAES